MKKSLKLVCGALLSTFLISCGSSNENVVEKYLPGTYTRDNRKEGKSDPEHYFKTLKIEHLKVNEYKITCQDKDKRDFVYEAGNKKIVFIPKTPDVFNFEISSVELEQKSDSISEYYIRGFVTNVIEDGTTYSYADSGVNEDGGITLLIGKNTVEAKISGNTLSSIRKK